MAGLVGSMGWWKEMLGIRLNSAQFQWKFPVEAEFGNITENKDLFNLDNKPDYIFRHILHFT